MNTFEFSALVLTFCVVVSGKPAFQNLDENVTPKCGYASCHPVQPGMLNVHIVPHTHDDVGWLKTVDQYYYGSQSNIQKAGVQYIIDSVIQELLTDSNKRFIYVETAYFWKWWRKQHDTLKYKVKKLVNRGQLEFIGGAWSMNDEAVTNYQSIIDQFAWGLRKLNETFGECGRPKIGWQIDPFGHSREMASIFAQLGYDGLLFGRLDFQDKTQRLRTKTAEMIWRASDSLGNSSDLFTSVLYNNYAPPPGFCFDVLCGDDPVIDDKRSTEYNADIMVQQFFTFVRQQSTNYQTNNIIITMGDDFNYQDAHKWFVNLDKLIRHANELQSNGSKINLLYSTPSCYLNAVYNEDKNKKWPVKSDDFFPYASDPNSYWTGYFTSRPTLKRFERLGNNFLQVCKQLYALTDLGPEDWVDLNAMREAMGIMQHHDAITGTEKQHVADDYSKILTDGFTECQIIASTALNKLQTKDSETQETPKLSLESCLLLNVSQCEISEKSKKFVVTVYNPLSRPVTHFARLPVTGKSYTVTDPSGAQITTQLLPIPDPVLVIPGRVSDATNELVFRAVDLPPLGFKSYFVEEQNGEDMTPREVFGNDKYVLKNKKIRIDFNPKTGKISRATLNGINDEDLNQEFLWYKGAVGNNEVFQNRSSGAYIFRPKGTEATPITSNTTWKHFNGPLCMEVHQIFNEWISQVVRLYYEESYIEFEWLVGPIPINDNIGKEIITRYTTKLASKGEFYTDSNGREVLKRVRNYRPTWNLTVSEPVAANYYPITSKILIRGKLPNNENDYEMAILTDRAQGGTSLKDGNLELMVHRRLLHDDAFGVGEALNETSNGKGLVARGHHYLVGGKTGDSQHSLQKDLAQKKLLAAWTFLTPIADSMSYQDYKKQYSMEFSGLKTPLPKNIQIMTLEPWTASSFLLRLEHIYEQNEDSTLSKATTVNVQNIFVPFIITSIRETTLGANQWIKENTRLNWKSGRKLEDYADNNYKFTHKSDDNIDISLLRNHYKETNEIPRDRDNMDDSEKINDSFVNNLYEQKDNFETFQFTLQPMQIRTFVIDIKKP